MLKISFTNRLCLNDAGNDPAAGLMDGWMDDLGFHVIFNCISVISGRCLDDNENLFTVEKISPRVRIELGPLDQ